MGTILEEDDTKSHVQEKTLHVGDHKLYDKKEIEPGRLHGITIHTHTRMIDNKSYVVKETRESKEIQSKEVITDMSEDEIQAFKVMWRQMWHPELTEEEILTRIQDGQLHKREARAALEILFSATKSDQPSIKKTQDESDDDLSSDENRPWGHEENEETRHHYSDYLHYYVKNCMYIVL